jgi:DNA-binding MarR family transcriptional regulator
MKKSSLDQYNDCIIFLLAKAYQKAHSNFKARLTAYGLTPIQHLILEALWEEEGLSAGEIGKKLILDGATLSGVLDRMDENGWIVKDTDSEDKRFLRIYLTEKSKDLKPVLTRARKESNDDLLNDLTLEEKVLLKRLLRDVQG